MARAQGARALMALAFETTYGTPPASGFARMPFASTSLGAEQPLMNSELLGYGRDPLAPVKDAVTVDGDVVVSLDAEAFGFWLRAAFGAPVTTSTAATGTIAFAANPTEGDTITLGGVTWSFVDDSPGTGETAISGTLSATLAALVSDLNGSADPEVGKASYSNPLGTDELLITFDSAGTSGNAFTIAASAATASGPQLTGGGRIHSFQSGSWTLPSMSIETGMPEVPRYAMYSGCVLDQLTWQMQRSGLLTATARLVAQGETVGTTTSAGTPAALELKRFGHFNGAITRNGSALGNVVSAEITYANNLDRIETIRSDGRIDGADPSIAALTGRIEVRFADQTLVTQAINGEACEMEFAYVLPSGESFTFTVHAVYLPRPRIEISGPQGVQASFDWQAARDSAVGRMCTATLINDIEEY
ncbi:phage tail tube protein [Paenirhodobacter sp.]